MSITKEKKLLSQGRVMVSRVKKTAVFSLAKHSMQATKTFSETSNANPVLRKLRLDNPSGMCFSAPEDAS
ncbi:MAG: hypothetical protein KKF85_01365 [Gammaproteobacteria bacterium]|nr:hypothetical protein [Rhodocyclaceae bacterium]MBU3908474.1 hypothetical protein [Gammaproteobacteria bacterium]MBU3988643.1 hypothetical protein [Gammaproteobacteria bacterium]MBU4004502.1 hypothetical protein [Gammaproteobacteria bacterium]MBU4021105.1 hypothetical protein [Gammaproteobacteria bacterium]